MQVTTTRTALGATIAAVRLEDAWRSLPAPDLSALLPSGADWSPGAGLDADVPGLPLPTPGKVICCGLNCVDHIQERGRDLAAYPTRSAMFAKHADTLIGADDDICAPASLEADCRALPGLHLHVHTAVPGDFVETEVPGIGVLTNTVRRIA